MKILLIFITTLYLSSDQMDCAEVTGYKRGSALFNCRYDYPKYKNHTKYFCKLENKRCTTKILSNTTADPDGKIFFMNVTPDMPGMYSVMIKNISQQDGGTYRCGVEKQGAQFTDVTLTVKEDACCGKLLSQTAHLGDNVTFTCTYPEEYKNFFKYLYKVTDHSLYAIVYTLGESAQNGRISLFDHPQKNLFNVNISDLMKEDGGLYMCGFQGTKDRSTNPYFSLVNEIHLEVSHKFPSIAIIVAVIVCVVLLLIGGLMLIFYKLRHRKTQDSTSSSTNRRNSANDDEDHHGLYYEEIQDTQPSSTTVYATTQNPMFPSTTQTAAVRTTEPPTDGDFYSMAQLSNPETESSAEYASVDHHT
ncbi:polymeric immunoglobulin receptor-like [Salminus brasiliensis]|uniref:polymeric immunoglobulin receptor-like n=1 Tax=Salminus brasiliensis TaxID=930266 RepID=UPI003B839F6F